MGWSSANEIFDPVARTLIELGADNDTKTRILGDLIRGLQGCDWDTEDESLEQFINDPAIVQAFANNEVHLTEEQQAALDKATFDSVLAVIARVRDWSEQLEDEDRNALLSILDDAPNAA
jgi:hypothetical protein